MIKLSWSCLVWPFVTFLRGNDCWLQPFDEKAATMMNAQRPSRWYRLILGVAAVGVVLVVVACTAQIFLAYSCGNPSSGHCYGTASWSQRGEYFGAYTDVAQVSLSCSS